MLTCEQCGSHAVAMKGPPREGADVYCSECGLWLGTYPTFFSRFTGVDEAVSRPAGAATSQRKDGEIGPTLPGRFGLPT
jgi:hypothetical protein